jgi:hypothetical protein
MADKQTVRMVLPLAELPAFFPLLQQGLWLQVEVGCSVIELLTDQFGIDVKYINERITTLFLDGKALDDPETAYVKDGSILALSSAMPGLVGSTMRRGSHLAAMRGDITYQSHPEESGTGRVKIKLFNMVMSELGETVLAHGFWLSKSDLLEFLHEQEENFWSDFTASLDGDQVAPDELIEVVSRVVSSGETVLQVEFKS